MTGKRYYLCTFNKTGESAGYFKTVAMDCHPSVYMKDHDVFILINSVEMTKEEYNEFSGA